MAIKAGANMLGLVSAMPGGPGVIEESLIAEIAEQVPPGVTSVLLTSLQEPTLIIEQQRRCRANALQLVDRLPAGSHQYLRAGVAGRGDCRRTLCSRHFARFRQSNLARQRIGGHQARA